MSSPPARHTVTGPPRGKATHAARPAPPPARLIATIAAAGVALAAFGLGAWALLGSTGPTRSTPTSAQLITVSPPEHP